MKEADVIADCRWGRWRHGSLIPFRNVQRRKRSRSGFFRPVTGNETARLDLAQRWYFRAASRDGKRAPQVIMASGWQMCRVGRLSVARYRLRRGRCPDDGYCRPQSLGVRVDGSAE
jgi:hypothetical protein